jgi:hypothetical protein
MSAMRLASYIARTATWIPASVIGLLFLPMALTRRTFGPDWTLHLWAIRQQQWNIQTMGHPGLFVSAKPLGAFYPLFAFVGSGIYSVGGYLAIVLGDNPLAAYKLLSLAGLCLAYGGFTWLSVQFGLRGWRSQIPGAVLVTGTYFLTNVYSRGDFAEFIAVSSIPFVLASVCCLLTSHQPRHWHRLALVGAVFVLTGSHNITLLWGSVSLGLLGLIALVTWAPAWRRPLPWKRVSQVLGLAAIGAGLNAWYLAPDLAYGLDTGIAKRTQLTTPSSFHVHLGLLLSPLRPTDRTMFASPFGYVRLSFPVLFFAWALVLTVVTWRRCDSAARRLTVALVCLTGAYAWLIVDRKPWKRLPHVLYNIQFRYRLGSYVLLTTALLVMLTLLWQARAREPVRRWTSVALVAIVLFNLGGAIWQVWSANSLYFSSVGPARAGNALADEVVASRYEKPRSWYSIIDFRDAAPRYVVVEAGRTVTVPLEKIRGSSFAGLLAVPEGRAPFTTNITGSIRFIRMTGIRAVGRTADGLVVAVRRARAPSSGPLSVTIRQAKTTPVRMGAWVSMASLIALLGLIAWPARRLVHARVSRGRDRRVGSDGSRHRPA